MSTGTGVAATQTGERIYGAAVELFFFAGYGGASLREVADAADVNVATIYHHYASKQALLGRIFERTVTDSHLAASKALENAGTPSEALRRLVRLHVGLHCDRAWEAGVCDREVNSLPTATRARVVATRDAYEQLWDDVLAAGARAGEFVIDDRGVLRIAMLTMCSQVAHWYQPMGRLDVGQVAYLYDRMCLRMAGFRRVPAVVARERLAQANV
jgi:AcrR family transcriptional regulator